MILIFYLTQLCHFYMDTKECRKKYKNKNVQECRLAVILIVWVPDNNRPTVTLNQHFFFFLPKRIISHLKLL